MRSCASAVVCHFLVIGFPALVPVSLASAEDWIKPGATRERPESYYDRESVTRDGDIAAVRIKTSPDEATARYFLLRLNCRNAAFSISEPVEKEQSQAYKFSPWEMNYPGSLAEGVWDHVCKKKRK